MAYGGIITLFRGWRVESGKDDRVERDRGNNVAGGFRVDPDLERAGTGPAQRGGYPGFVFPNRVLPWQLTLLPILPQRRAMTVSRSVISTRIARSTL